MAEGTVHGDSPAKFQSNPQMNKRWKMCAMKQLMISAEYRDMLLRPRLDLSGTPGLRPIDLSQVPDKPAMAWVACPAILHRSYFVYLSVTVYHELITFSAIIAKHLFFFCKSYS